MDDGLYLGLILSLSTTQTSLDVPTYLGFNSRPSHTQTSVEVPIYLGLISLPVKIQTSLELPPDLGFNSRLSQDHLLDNILIKNIFISVYLGVMSITPKRKVR